MSGRVLLAIVALLVAGCGSSPSATPSAASAPPPTSTPTASASSASSAGGSASATPAASHRASAPAPTASRGGAPSDQPPSSRPSAAAFDLPDTPITAAIDQAYNTTGDAFNPADLGGVRPGEVTARWYVADDRWAVHYDGLDADRTGPLCPGSSAQTAAGFEHVSNAPTETGACDGFDATLARGDVGVRRCGDEVLYLTAIPADVEGTLFASIETRYQVAGSVVGITGAADPGDGEAPEIDLDDPSCEVVPAGP